MKNRVIILILAMVFTLVCMPLSAQANDDNVEEMIEILDEIRSLANELHDQSEFIADDVEPTVGLDWKLMGKAEVVHGTSHDIERFASIAHDRLKDGLDTGEFDKNEITRRITMLQGVTNAISPLVDDIDHETPQSHREYADALRNAQSDLQQLVSELHLMAESAVFVAENNVDIYLMGKAEVIHGTSHDMGRFANIGYNELNRGLETGEFNKNEITRRITMLQGVTNAISPLVDDIDHETPQSHREYADALKSEFAFLQELSSQLNQLTVEENASEMSEIMQQIMDISREIHDISEFIADDVDPAADDTIIDEVDDPVEQDPETEDTPGLGAISAAFGILSMAYLIRR